MTGHPDHDTDDRPYEIAIFLTSDELGALLVDPDKVLTVEQVTLRDSVQRKLMDAHHYDRNRRRMSKRPLAERIIEANQ